MSITKRNLSILRSYYFLLGVGGGFLLPFLALFFKQQGLSGTQIGLLSTFAGLAALIAAPLWGRFSDAASKPRRLLQFELLASACLMLVLSQQTLVRLDRRHRRVGCADECGFIAQQRCAGAGRVEQGSIGVWQRAPVRFAGLGHYGVCQRLVE